MIQKKLTLGEAAELSSSLPFAYIRTTEQVILGKNPGFTVSEDLIEARWFSKTGELRLFERSGEFCAVFIACEDGDNCILNQFSLANPARFGSRLTIRRYLRPDEDGQNNVQATCLAGWKGDERNV